MEEKIITVIVTFNRLKLLQRAIKCVQKQTCPIAEIIVVNNGSTDGTTEWLSSVVGINVINQENVGGAGGFYTGIKEAYARGADRIWCMDDDVYPTETCLSVLMSYLNQHSNIGIIVPRRLQAGNIVYGETLKFNLVNPFRSLNNFLKEENVGTKELVKIEGMAFEGPLISRSVVEKIGFPNKDLFIFFDDSDYSYRATIAGFDVMYCKEAILNKELFPFQALGKEEYRNNWKLFYDLRNTSYFCKKYGKNRIYQQCGEFLKYLHAFIAILMSVMLRNKKYKKEELEKAYRAIQMGKTQKLGKLSN